jgi:hypothetical protein
MVAWKFREDAMRLGLILLFSAALPLAGWAGAVDLETARSQLFPVKGHSVQVSPKLSQRDRATIVALVPYMAKQMNQPVQYYASIAYSPGDGLVHEALQAALNHHSTGAADAAALRACEAKKSRGAPACQIAARVLPKGYAKRSLTLSVQATAAVNGPFRKMRGPKSFAASPKTGKWGMGAGDAAARSACGVKDCEIVIRE